LLSVLVTCDNARQPLGCHLGFNLIDAVKLTQFSLLR